MSLTDYILCFFKSKHIYNESKRIKQLEEEANFLAEIVQTYEPFRSIESIRKEAREAIKHYVR